MTGRNKTKPPLYTPRKKKKKIEIVQWGVGEVFDYVLLEKKKKKEEKWPDRKVSGRRRFNAALMRPRWRVKHRTHLFPPVLSLICSARLGIGEKTGKKYIARVMDGKKAIVRMAKSKAQLYMFKGPLWTREANILLKTHSARSWNCQ